MYKGQAEERASGSWGGGGLRRRGRDHARGAAVRAHDRPGREGTGGGEKSRHREWMRVDVATGELLNPEVANLVRCRSRDAMEDVIAKVM